MKRDGTLQSILVFHRCSEAGGQQYSHKFVLGCIKFGGEVYNFNTHCGISSTTVLTSLLFHEKIAWPDFGRVYNYIYRYNPCRYATGGL